MRLELVLAEQHQSVTPEVTFSVQRSEEEERLNLQCVVYRALPNIVMNIQGPGLAEYTPVLGTLRGDTYSAQISTMLKISKKQKNTQQTFKCVIVWMKNGFNETFNVTRVLKLSKYHGVLILNIISFSLLLHKIRHLVDIINNSPLKTMGIGLGYSFCIIILYTI